MNQTMNQTEGKAQKQKQDSGSNANKYYVTYLSLKVNRGGTHQVALIISLLHGRRGL